MEINDKTKKIGAVFGTIGIAIISTAGFLKLIKKKKPNSLRLKTLEKREEALHAQYGERLRCVYCKYCKRRLYAPFFSHPVKHWVPLYCKKFMFTLPPDVKLRCGALLPEDAQREGK